MEDATNNTVEAEAAVAAAPTSQQDAAAPSAPVAVSAASPAEASPAAEQLSRPKPPPPPPPKPKPPPPKAAKPVLRSAGGDTAGDATGAAGEEPPAKPVLRLSGKKATAFGNRASGAAGGAGGSAGNANRLPAGAPRGAAQPRGAAAPPPPSAGVAAVRPSLEMLLGETPSGNLPPGAVRAGGALHLQRRVPPKERVLRFIRKFGAESLAFSLLVHAVLLFLAVFVFVAINSNVDTQVDITDTFQSGMRGNRSQIDTNSMRVSPKNSKQKMRSIKPIRAKVISNISRPEVPDIQSLFATGDAGGGMGPGNDPLRRPGNPFAIKRFARYPIKVAVYLDNSGSMRPYLPTVKRNIYEQFPDADIFEFDGILVDVQNNRVRGGTNGEGTPVVIDAKRKTEEKNQEQKQRLRSLLGKAAVRVVLEMSEEERKELEDALDDEQRNFYTKQLSYRDDQDTYLRLTNRGREIYKRYLKNFRQGSVGAWTDIMIYEKYDALIIFSDFQDGVQERGTVFEGEQRWDDRWESRFAKAKTKDDWRRPQGPKLFLFSTEVEPQPVWQRCVKASGGEIKMKPNLRN